MGGPDSKFAAVCRQILSNFDFKQTSGTVLFLLFSTCYIFPLFKTNLGVLLQRRDDGVGDRTDARAAPHVERLKGKGSVVTFL